MRIYKETDLDNIEEMIGDLLLDGSEHIYKYTLRLPASEGLDYVIQGFTSGNSAYAAYDKFRVILGGSYGMWKKMTIHKAENNEVLLTHMGY